MAARTILQFQQIQLKSLVLLFFFCKSCGSIELIRKYLLWIRQHQIQKV